MLQQHCQTIILPTSTHQIGACAYITGKADPATSVTSTNIGKASEV